MPANYVLLERIELNASAASITFSNIPQSGYTDLKVVISARSDYAAQYNFCALTFNGSATGYSARYVSGIGSTVSSSTGYTDKFRIDAPAASNTANTFSNAEIYIPNYTSSNNKSISVDWTYESNSTSNNELQLLAGLWSNSAAITSITYTALNSSTLTANSTFSLYGLAAVGTTPVIAPKASGGNITTDGTYWIHTFNSTGTFVPQTGLTADVLVVAGGGGGGSSTNDLCPGGGGAGGLLTSTGVSLTSSYTVTIGAGGSAGTVGSNSVFNSITATGGGYGSSTGISASSGGSGGGGGSSPTYYPGASASPSGQGNAGGTGYTGGQRGAGGGGGAGAVGGNGTFTTAGVGGNGSANSYSGTSVTYAGGGGAGYGSAIGNSGLGGSGGGGRGSLTDGGNGVAGTANTGGGGGGSGTFSGTGGSGGSGIVIIRYPIA